MEVVTESKVLKPLLSTGSAMTVGTFDGVHLGHKTLIEYVVTEAHRRGLKSLVLTFEPHPIYVLRPEIKVERIALPDEKIARLSNFGLDYLLILNFNTKLANFKARYFFENILIDDLNARFIALGFNHTFGKNREGNFEFLQKIAPDKGCDVSQIDPYIFNGDPVSSSRIRKALKNGDIENANDMLNEPFTLPGQIIKGKGVGHKIGYPTINMKIDEGKLIPHAGVYAAAVEIAGKDYRGMMYIHPQPESCELEMNIFDFAGDIYEQHAVVKPKVFTREAIKFSDYESLSLQLAKDEEEIKHIFGIV